MFLDWNGSSDTALRIGAIMGIRKAVKWKVGLIVLAGNRSWTKPSPCSARASTDFPGPLKAALRPDNWLKPERTPLKSDLGFTRSRSCSAKLSKWIPRRLNHQTCSLRPPSRRNGTIAFSEGPARPAGKSTRCVFTAQAGGIAGYATAAGKPTPRRRHQSLPEHKRRLLG